MSSAIKDGSLTAFQRWEMASFGDNRPSHNEKPPAPPPQAVPHVSEAELEQIRDAAHQEGYASGYQEAYERGLREGQEAGYSAMEEGLQKEISSLKALATHFSSELAAASSQMGQNLLDLAVDLAEAMLKAKFEVDQESIIPIVEDAIEQLASVQQPAQILLNPEDANIIKKELGESLSEKGWRIVSDQHIERGGCKLETQHNIVDATYSTRWQHLTQLIKKPIS
ncbi:MAG: flagellar assembly protein FliH [Burkholderiales bacterium]|nr:flagellar assembly protein FliH [Burkholderiales bacterium]